MASASKGYFALSEETTAGEAVTSPEFFYPVQSVDFPYENQYIENFEIRGSRQAVTTQPGAVEGSASVSGVIYPSGAMGKLLKGLMGSVTSDLVDGGTATWIHEFGDTQEGALPYFTLERADAFADEGDMFAERLAGSKVESFSIECPFGDLVTFNTNFQAIKAPKVVSAAIRPDNPWPTTRPLTFTGASITVDGQQNSLFTDLSVELTNNLQRQNTLNGTNESYKIFEGGLSCTLSGSAVFEDMTLRNLLEQGTTFAVGFTISNGRTLENGEKEGLRFEWSNVKLASVGNPMQANEVITSDVTFRIDFDNAANASVKVFMINEDDGAEYV